MELNFHWFYGRDLRQLSDEELGQAVVWLRDRGIFNLRSRYAKVAYDSILTEWNRRNFPPIIGLQKF